MSNHNKKVFVLAIALLILFSIQVSAVKTWGIFTSIWEHNGDFGGIQGADEICQDDAEYKGYSGTWIALLSDSSLDASDRLSEGRFHAIENDDKIIAYSVNDLFDGEIDNYISTRGGDVWTGTLYYGKKASANCDDWKSTSENAITGYNFNPEGYVWVQKETQSCSEENVLYCVEISTLDERPEWKMFVSWHTWTGYMCHRDYTWENEFMCDLTGSLIGIRAADKTCQQEADEFGLEGNYVAFLSNATLDAKDRLWNYGKYVDVDGEFVGGKFKNIYRGIIAENKGDLFSDQIIFSPSKTLKETQWEAGKKVWTGSLATGKKDVNYCNNWEDDDTYYGAYGLIAQERNNPENWIQKDLHDKIICDTVSHPVYCVEVPTCTDSDGDGYYIEDICSADEVDCRDEVDHINPGAEEDCSDRTDNDCDGLKDAADPDCNCEPTTEICDYEDNDCDGEIDEGFILYIDSDGDGHAKTTPMGDGYCSKSEGGKYYKIGDDCDDSKINVNPTEPEVSDGIDNNCNGKIDETDIDYYFDGDGDGFGDIETVFSWEKSYPPDGYVADSSDCDDSKDFIYPGAPEICDDYDNDCNGEINEGMAIYTNYRDLDGDGFGDSQSILRWCSDTKDGIKYIKEHTDCNDNLGIGANVYPGAPEICDGIDNQCMGDTGYGSVDENCCGNNVADAIEDCDIVDSKGSSVFLSRWSCESYSSSYSYLIQERYIGGTLNCENCEFETSSCEQAVCGNDKREGSEKCDGTDISIDCKFLGFDYGNLKCRDDCKYDESSCNFYDCGNGILNGNEECDGNNKNTTTCADLGFTTGSLGCKANCKFDTSQCISVCGNNIKEDGEVCDGIDTAGTNCANANYASGDLTCKGDCQSFDYTDCNKIICGDGICSSGEKGKCNMDCLKKEKEIVRVAVSICGDKYLGLAEQCDGQLLGGYTCVDIGFTGGTLSCTNDCRLNITFCNYLGSSETTAKVLAKQTLSNAIKTANMLIMQAKTEDIDTAKAETLLLDIIKDYADGSTDYEIMTEELQKIPTLLEGGEVVEQEELPVSYIIGVIVLVLILMLAFMFKGLGKSE